MTEATNNGFTACDMATAAAQGFRDGVASVRPVPPSAAVVPEQMLSIGVDATKDGAHVCLMVKGSGDAVQVIHSQFYAARKDGAGSIVQLPVRDLYTAPPAAAVVMPERLTPAAACTGDANAAQHACDWYNSALDDVARLNPAPDHLRDAAKMVPAVEQSAMVVPEGWLPMDTAPKDGTLLRLLVEFDDHPTEDTDGPAPTIGANYSDNGGPDEWQFAGWDWMQDVFIQGRGTPVGWLPMLADAPTPEPASPQTGAARDVLAERQRQVESEGWTPEHDDEHDEGQMAVAGGLYAQYAFCNRELMVLSPPMPWPWHESWWKPCAPRRMLVKAGALILAEIERLDRAEQPAKEQGQ